MGDRFIHAERPSYHSRLANFQMLSFAPLVVALISEVLAQPVSLSRGRLGNFEPSELTLWLAGLLGVLYASVVAVSTARAAQELQRSRTRLYGADLLARPDDSSPHGAVGLTFFLSLIFGVVGAIFLCGAVNRLMGDAVVESARVAGIRTENNRRCSGKRVSLYGASLPKGGTLCVDAGRVSSQATGQALRIVVFRSPLGRQFGLDDSSSPTETSS